jgi:GxxExxY protein
MLIHLKKEFIKMDHNQITEKIIGAAIQVHKIFGPGMLESVYEECLAFELERLNLTVEKQKSIPIIYKDIKFDCGYRIDMMVENKVLLELKAIESITNVHMAQILTYMKFANVEIRLLINFKVTKLINGIKRFIL